MATGLGRAVRPDERAVFQLCDAAFEQIASALGLRGPDLGLLSQASGFCQRIVTFVEGLFECVDPFLEGIADFLGLIEADPTLAPRSAVFDLADSLSGVFDEMYGEGVDPANDIGSTPHRAD